MKQPSVRARCTPEFKRYVNSVATQLGLTESDFVRQALDWFLGQLDPREPRNKEIEQRYLELARARVKAGPYPSKSDQGDLLNEGTSSTSHAAEVVGKLLPEAEVEGATRKRRRATGKR